MEENKFEKKVQQRMDELKIQPSELVWTKIEKRIVRKKPAKHFARLFLFLLFLSAGGYYFLQLKKSQNNVKNSVPTQTKNLDKTNHKLVDPILVLNENKITPSNQKLSESKEIRHEGSNDKIEKSLQKRITSNKNHSRNDVESIIKTGFEKVDETKNIFSKTKSPKNDIDKSEVNTDTLTQSIFKEEKVVIEKVDNLLSPTEQSVGNIISSDRISNNIPEKIKEEKVTEIKMNVDSKEKMKSQWLWGFNFSLGKSFVIGPDPETAGYWAALSNPIYNPPFITNTGYPKIQSRVAFIVGVSAQRNISKKISFSMGINYKYFSTSNKVGDNILAGGYSVYSSNGVFQDYRNSYHFVEIPLGIIVETRQNKKIPLAWKIGVTLGQMISSNSLQYSLLNYYHKNELYNKVRLGANAGLYTSIIDRFNYKLNFGPYISYEINNMSREGFYAKKHSIFIGIKAAVLFKKK